jgi:hypothetical protein
MPIFKYTAGALMPIEETTFAAEGIMERSDLQRLLRDQINVLEDRLMVVAEGFGEWLDSRREIDLLCIDSDANLVVVELKRTEDGGHMELQALRYAAMISEMTFDQLVETFDRYRNEGRTDIEASKTEILEFLGWSEVKEDEFAQDTRVLLAAADFSREVTTAVLWLRTHKVDIRCVRMKPYKMGDGTLLLDVQQLIPLPETSDFQTKIGLKKQAERQNRTDRHELRLKFWKELLTLAITKTNLHENCKATHLAWISRAIGRGFWLGYSVRQTDSQVELWIAHGSGQKAKNKAAFKLMEGLKSSIESDFGAELEWQELPESDGCRIRYVVVGGYRSPTDQWPSIHAGLVDAMVRLDKAMRPKTAQLPL